MTAPHPEGVGAALAMTRALKDASTAPSEVRFVNAHGTGTPLNDVAESKALRSVFGEASSCPPLTATKASVGHLLGAAGAIEAVATVLFLEAGVVGPGPGCGEADEQLDVDLVVGSARPVGAGPAVSTNLAFGGANAVVVLDRWSDS
jgi:3-oxoacyl-[acyl-carrier-protein] synthase II